jgi:hypothetical protein
LPLDVFLNQENSKKYEDNPTLSVGKERTVKSNRHSAGRFGYPFAAVQN